MGCDVHMVVERRLSGNGSKWIGLYCTDHAPGHRSRPPIAQRDYDFFGRLASVRSQPEGPRDYPKFIPGDVSELALVEMTRFGSDGHSHSHLPLARVIQHWISSQGARPLAKPEERTVSAIAYQEFGVDLDYPEDAEYRVVFWFDN